MLEESDAKSLGNPEPIDEPDFWRSLFDWGVIAATVCGGFLAFTHLVVPTRLSGASRSARLKWQQRQAEAEQVVSTSQQAGPTTLINSNASPPLPPNE
jgi:hypothetical protein